MILFFLVILISALGIKYFNDNYIYTDTISENIFIENIDLSLLSKEDALKKLKNDIKINDITLKYNDKEYNITPNDFDLKYNFEELVDKAFYYTKTDDYFENVKRFFNLKNNKKEFSITPTYDEAKLSAMIDNISKDINIEVKDATVYISDSGDVSKTKSRTGLELDVVSAKEDIYNAIKSKEDKIIELNVKVIEPRISTDDANSVNALLAEYTTKFSTSNKNRSENISIAAQKTSDVVLMPGEEFSYNTLTGRRTKANGYKDAPVIINGKLEEDVGGGVCQVSSTLFNSVMYSGLDITSRRNHSLKSSYVPIGQDAMVADGGSDFRFKNNYNHPVYIKNIVHDGYITSRIYGNIEDKKNITIKVDAYKENGLDAAKTYIEYRDESGNITDTEYIGKSIYKNPK